MTGCTRQDYTVADLRINGGGGAPGIWRLCPQREYRGKVPAGISGGEASPPEAEA